MAESPSRPNASASGGGRDKKIRATAVSRGSIVGPVVCLFGEHRQFFRREIGRSDIEAEVSRLGTAVETAKRQLNAIQKREAVKRADSGKGIFGAHLQIIEDSSLTARIEETIASQLVNAEWAVKSVSDAFIAKFKAIEDEHLKERYIDIEDVAERILTALGGKVVRQFKLPPDAIIAAKELRPSTVIELSDGSPHGIITENGGWTSHTFILAREIGWPAVTGVENIFRRLANGDTAFVDGFAGRVIVNPSKDTLRKHAIVRGYPEDRLSVARPSPGDLKTLDGLPVTILANSESPAAYQAAHRSGAKGIGLYRSEYLFDRYRGFPPESVQYRAYRDIADAAGKYGVKIRTFDVGPDRLFEHGTLREKNPALGLKGVRYGFRDPRHMRTQFRAVLRASAGRKVDIVIPMVSGVDEVRRVRSLIGKELAALGAQGKEAGRVGCGVMVEIPSAAFLIEEIVKEADFVCIGTNDLIQYMLAADRDDENVAEWYQTLHPAVLRVIHRIVGAAATAGKRAVICGEMAGSPFYVPLLIGLGATELSMNVHSIDRIARVVQGIAADEARRLFRDVSKLDTAAEIEEMIKDSIRTNWVHLFPAKFSLR